MLNLKIKIVIYFFISLWGGFTYANADTSLVAKFTFNNGNLNSKPGNIRAKLVGVSSVKDRFGNENSAFYFHGNYGSYINLGTDTLLKPIIGSVSLWFKMENVVMSGQGALFNPIILTKSQPGDDFFEGYSINYDVNSGRVGIATTFSELNQVSLRSTESVELGKWYHVVLTYDNRFLNLYINGEIDTKMKKGFTSRFLRTDSVMLGNSANKKNDRFFNGIIDDVAIYNKVLSEDEVKELYHEANPNRYVVLGQVVLAVISIIAIVILIVWLSVRRYKKVTARKQLQEELENRMLELETKAIRTQMNPHFIFNSLNTLHRFILESDLEHAEKYLTKFSKLLRKLMESSTTDKIVLAEEIDILKGYLEIEKMRFAHSFEFEIKCDVNEINEVYIPFMLIQPFVENAIWHGLIPKEGNRMISITFTKEDENKILCVVDDNGVGREEAKKRKDPLKKKSLAIDFIKQRLELLSQIKGIKCGFTITDKKDTNQNNIGTKVEILIPILN